MADKVCKKRRRAVTPFFRYYQKPQGGAQASPKQGASKQSLQNCFFDFLKYGFLIFNIKNDFLEKRLSNPFIEIKKTYKNAQELHNEYALGNPFFAFL